MPGMTILRGKTLALALFLFAGIAIAQPATRTVQISWPASPSGVTGYTIATAAAVAGPFTIIGCTGTVTGSPVACVTGSTSTTTTFTDTETIGSTVFYQVNAIAVNCTPTTPATSVCGQGSPSAGSTTIPLKPGTGVIVIVVP